MHRYPVNLIACIYGLVCIATAGSLLHAEIHIPMNADALVDSIGVNVHLGYLDTAYSQFDNIIKPRLQELGIRHVRDGSPSYQAAHDPNHYYVQRHNQLGGIGIKTIFIFDPRLIQPWEAIDAIHAVEDVIDAVEGPNEMDLNLQVTYNGQSFPDGVRNYQDDLYNTVKGEVSTSHLPVVMTSLGNPDSADLFIPPGGAPLETADFANMHSYTGHNPPCFQWDWYTLKAQHVCDRPIFATETGYHNAIDHDPTSGGLWMYGISEQAAAKYISRLYFMSFKRDVKRTYLYEFIDEIEDPVEPERNFGLLRNDGSTKPAFNVMKNIITVLQDPGPTFQAMPMNYSFTGQIDDIEHMLLQKRDGRFYLVVWANTESYGIELKSDIAVADRQVTLELNYPATYANIYRPLDSPDVEQSYQSPTEIQLNVPDHPLIVEFEIIPLPPPSDLAAVFNDVLSLVVLEWSDNSSGNDQEDYFIVQRKPDRSGFHWTTLAILPPDTVVYVDSSEFYGFVEYLYRVGTFKAD